LPPSIQAGARVKVFFSGKLYIQIIFPISDFRNKLKHSKTEKKNVLHTWNFVDQLEFLSDNFSPNELKTEKIWKIDLEIIQNYMTKDIIIKAEVIET
jgi:hypothetical protein